MTNKKDIKVAAVVVTYNRLQLLKECIEALRNQTYKNLDLVIVNNGSTDGTGEWLAMQKDLIVITQENLGGAGGFNTGMRYVAEHGYDYCWVMDDDVICDANALQEFFNSFSIVGENFGFLCSSVFDKFGNPCNVPSVLPASKKGYPDWPKYLDNGIVKVVLATFVSVFVPTENIRKYGLPIKDFFIWGDDSEFTYRMSKHLPCYMIGKSQVTHMREMAKGLVFLKETNPNRIKMYKYMYRNGFYNARKGCSVSNYPLILYVKQCFSIFIKGLIRFKFKHLGVLIQGVCTALFFHPKIEFTESKENDMTATNL